MPTKDTLYKEAKPSHDFQFSEKVAEVFDDMLDRSVPCYRQLIGMMGGLLDAFLQDNDLVYDLGCSTGTTLLELSRARKASNLRYVGIDNSEAMLKKARIKAEMYAKKECLHYIHGDVLEVPLQPAAAILCNYTLQFIRPLKRPILVKKLFDALHPGGILIISEKIISKDSAINHTFIDQYLDFKRHQGYSELEIAQKREALENVLVPFANDENIALLQDAGFTAVEPFFRWFNFTSYLAIKEPCPSL